jgi:murein peptide amidase A
MRLKSKSRQAAQLVIALSCYAVAPDSPAAEFRTTDHVTNEAFLSLPTVLRSNFKDFVIAAQGEQSPVKALCDRLSKRYGVFRWNPVSDGCTDSKVEWQTRLKSNDGNALLFAEFGKGEMTTLILSAVHPDELTPVPLGFKFANYLAAHRHIIPADTRVIIAPLVNPDGFFRKVSTRINGQGVDLNRNFFTQDWYAAAKNWWVTRRQKNRNHFPGHIPNSEIETLFQIWLIDTYKPDKIISIHAPLGFYDYDGPGDQRLRPLTDSEEKARNLVRFMSASSKNYKIVDYSFYPGSLGNYAGNERGIPTITLELETTNPNKTKEYWDQFSPGLIQAVKFPFINQAAPTAKGSSLFLDPYGDKTALRVTYDESMPVAH